MASALSCNHFPTCSGCSSIGIEYQQQLEAKLRSVRAYFERASLDTFDANSILSIAPSPKTTGYRNRAKLVPALRGGRVSLGLYRAGSHDVVDIPDCPVQTDGINRAVEVIRAGIAESDVSLYDEVAHTGDLRYVTVREGTRTGQILVGLVTRASAFPEGEQLARYVMDRCEGAVGVVQNINPEKGNVIFGKVTRLLSGRDNVEEVICDVRIRLGLTSFFQVNTDVAEKAYESILTGLTCQALAGKPPVAPERSMRGKPPVAPEARDLTLLDLYTGVGAIGLAAARNVRQVHGIEESAEAVAFAQAAARANDLPNVEFDEGLVEDRLDEVVAPFKEEGIDGDRLVAVVNPPRKGVLDAAIAALSRARPVRIAYLSCAPSTLIRDLARLESGGYRVAHVELFDMFPQTEQVETLAILERSHTGARPRGDASEAHE